MINTASFVPFPGLNPNCMLLTVISFLIVELKFIHFIFCCIHTVWCVSGHLVIMINQIKCQLGDYGEEPRQ